jgi:hypothetical protein
MTLDEAIKHCENVAAKCFVERSARNHSGKCGFEHLELAAWLRELKAYKEQEPCTDAISKQAAIRWVKTECNPYGKPTLDFESGKKVIEHLKHMPSVTPKQKTGHLKLVERGKNIDLCCSNCGAVRIKDIAYNYTTDELSKMEDFKNLLKHSEMSYCPSCGAKMENEDI